MPPRKLRFRHVHLDFHTSPAIPGIGAKFERAQWQDALRAGHVNSINVFAKCHHGWSYHPTAVGQMHPHLKFDLLRAQIDASAALDVKTPIYVSAGVDNVAAQAHPEWREISVEGRYAPIHYACFHKMCFNTAYLDYLCEQIREVARRYPDGDGLWLDIISQGECCCTTCVAWMQAQGLDISKAEDRRTCAAAALERYYREATAAARCANSNLPVFHNSGHIPRGRRDLLRYFSHLELESLPTGGWGYDHYPLSANYCQKLGLDFVGMTGKFHTTWGEFGGYKHPHALRYECAAMLAYGSKCCVGDQLHPSGEMDLSTYRLIGAAYAEVEQKEPWCDDVTPVADLAVLSSEAENGREQGDATDAGVGRVMLEEHFLFDLVDRAQDFAAYKLLILPDDILVDPPLQRKIADYVAAGGKLLLTGRSGLNKDGSGPAFDIGATWHGESEFQPDYVLAGEALAPSFVQHPLVMYLRSQKVKPTTGQALAQVHQPYFNRTWDHFCSHQHAPPAGPSGFAAAVQSGNILYLAHPLFTLYRHMGAVAYREYAARAIRRLLGPATLNANLPSTARISLMKQAGQQRYVLHLLYANPIARGGRAALSPEGYVRDATPVEVIEDLVPLHDVRVSLRIAEPIRRVTLEPQGRELPFTRDGAELRFSLDAFTCHQMVVLHYA